MDEMRFQEMAEILPYQIHPMGERNFKTIEGRYIQRFLGSTKDYTNWIKDQIERGGLIENRDFIIFALKGENSGRGRSRTEYHFTFEAAKEICMMSETTKGKEVREYFLECERRAHGITPVQYPEQSLEAWILGFGKVVQGELRLIRIDVHHLQDDVNGLRDTIQGYEFRLTQAENTAYEANHLAYKTAFDVVHDKKERQKRAKKRVPEWMRNFLVTVTDGHCMRCGCPCRWDVPETEPCYGHIDHIKRPKDGDVADLRLLQLLCQDCHKYKTRLEDEGVPYWNLDYRSEEVKLKVVTLLKKRQHARAERNRRQQLDIFLDMLDDDSSSPAA